jgi:ABC-type transporter Mla MlaB component
LGIDESRRGGILILEVKGKLELGAPCASLRRRFCDLLDSGDRRFVIDLRKATKLDSAGLAELSHCWISARQLGASVKLVFHQEGEAPSGPYVTSSVLDPLADRVEWYSTLEDAMRSF